MQTSRGFASPYSVLAITLAILSALVVSAALAEDAPAPKVITKGGVRLYPDEKRLEMDGKFCLAEGPLELLVCAKGGKDYESVITCDVSPYMLHLCLLALKLRPAPENVGPRFQGDAEHAPAGSPVNISVRWGEGKNTKTVRAEELCWNVIDKRIMDRTAWVFTGSKFLEDPDTKRKRYWADVEKTLVAVYWDPYAVLDLPLRLGANDEAFVVNKQVVPEVGTPCTVIIEPAGPPSPPARNPEGGRMFLVDITAGGRVLVESAAPNDLVEALKTIAWYAPKDTCKVSIDHGAPGEAVAAAFDALAAAGIGIDAVETARTEPGALDVITLDVAGDAVRFNAKALPDDLARAAVRNAVAGKEKAGIVIKAGKDASLKGMARAFRACADAKDGFIRVEWQAGRMASAAGARNPGPGLDPPKNAGGGIVITVQIAADGRILIAGTPFAKPEEALRTFGWYAPQDSCAVVIEHGAMPAAVATVLESLNFGGTELESVQMTKEQPGIPDAATVLISGIKTMLNEKELFDDDLKAAVEAAIGNKKAGFTIKVEPGTHLGMLVRTLRTFDDTKVPVRIVWPERRGAGR